MPIEAHFLAWCAAVLLCLTANINLLMQNRILAFLLPCMACLCNCSIANIETDSDVYMSDREHMEILPIYRDPGSIEENFTTEVCNYVWNGEAFSHVWPQSRKELSNLILSLSLGKKSFHNLHIFVIIDSQENNAFGKNLDNLREALIFSSLLEIPVVVSLAEKDTYTTITPSYNLGPDCQLITIYPNRVEWLREDGATLTLDFNETKHVLRDFISTQKKDSFMLKWFPSQYNVAVLLELLKKMNMNSCNYSFEIVF